MLWFLPRRNEKGIRVKIRNSPRCCKFYQALLTNATNFIGKASKVKQVRRPANANLVTILSEEKLTTGLI